MDQSNEQPVSEPPTNRMLHYQEFMERFLGISPNTPLADVRPTAIVAAGRVPGGPYASILAHAAEEARKLTPNNLSCLDGNSRAVIVRMPPSGPSKHGASQPFGQKHNPSQARPHAQLQPVIPRPVIGPSLITVSCARLPSDNRDHVPSYIAPESLRKILELTIIRRNLPPRLIHRAFQPVNSGHATSGGNYRVDVSNWEFRKQDEGHTLIVGELLRGAKDLGFISSQIMQTGPPPVIRMVFTTQRGAQMFLDALLVKGNHPRISEYDLTAEFRLAGLNRQIVYQHPAEQYSSGPMMNDQYPRVTSFQSSVDAMVDSYRPSGKLREKPQPARPARREHPAESLREFEYGRLSPAPCEPPMMQGPLSSPRRQDSVGVPNRPQIAVKKENMPPNSGLSLKREALSEGEIEQGQLPKRAKRMCAADFLDMDHMP
ncbi:hypothetical protein EJ08DRAFT_699293 [Tothia fuscella]|uniref:Uncharacterized protein n=1 Tax=Tothia fuscella TaxID=1048955 RepID=A0A9P4TWE3_9PEZI|nr:hypothetical protein EJ08DRAFT_699293 [Tothia fuscella]